jgi:MFS family permease
VSSIVQSITGTVIAFIPLLMVDRFGFQKGMGVGLIQSLVYSAGLWASPVGGYIADRIGKTKLVLLVSLVVGPVIYLLNAIPYGVITWALLFIIGITIYFRAPATEAYIMNNSPVKHRSTMLGIYFFAHTEGSSLLLPIIGGMTDRFGFQTTFSIAALTATAVAIASIPLMWRKED